MVLIKIKECCDLNTLCISPNKDKKRRKTMESLSVLCSTISLHFFSVLSVSNASLEISSKIKKISTHTYITLYNIIKVMKAM